MTGKQKFMTIIYFAPMALFLLPIKAPQTASFEIVKADIANKPQAPEIITQPTPQPTPDIRTGKHKTTDDERAIIKTNFLTRWDESQWSAFDELIGGESGWIAGRKNTSSGACGLGQALPCSKYTDGAELGDAINEANWSMDYIKNRYETPKNALNKWKNRHPHWY